MDFEEFIEAVREFPELFDKSHRNYMNARHKEKIWKSLDTNFKIEAKKKWTYLRDRYVKEIRKMDSSSGSVTENKITWSLFPNMSFLSNYIKLRRTTDNSLLKEDVKGFSLQSMDSVSSPQPIQTSETIIEHVDCAYNIIEEEDCIEDQPSQYDKFMRPLDDNSLLDPIPTKLPAKRQKYAEMVNPVKDSLLDAITTFKKTCKSDDSTENDGDVFFLKSIAVDMKKMSAEAKIDFKITMLRKVKKAIRESTN